MTLDEAIERYTSNAEYERTHGNLQGCLEFRQFVGWLKDYKRLLEQEPILDKIRAEIEKVVWEDVVVSLDGTDEVRIPRLEPDEVLNIIDKYREESEDAE